VFTARSFQFVLRTVLHESNNPLASSICTYKNKSTSYYTLLNSVHCRNCAGSSYEGNYLHIQNFIRRWWSKDKCLQACFNFM